MNGPAPAAPSGADHDAGETRSFDAPIHRFHMFRPIGTPASIVTLFLDGRPIMAYPHETVAACLLRNKIPYFRTTPVSGAPRLPYCMIGQCFDCLVEIEGIGSSQACLIQVKAGMRVFRQDGAASAEWVAPQ
jgi:D-hydroxyproline dehydrogenase subunit gamma